MNTEMNKKKIIMLLIMFGLVLSIIMGVTFSYLLPIINNVETDSTVVFNAGIISATYENGSNQIVSSEVLPGWSETKTFSLTAVNSTTIRKAGAMNYSLKLIVDSNTFSDNSIAVSLKSTNTSNNGTPAEMISGTLLSGPSEVSLGFGSFDATQEIGEEGVTHDFELKLSFPEQYRSQNNDMDKSIAAHVVVERANDLGNLTIVDNYESYNKTINIEKNKEVNLLSLYSYPIKKTYSIISGEGTINSNKLTLKSDEMKVSINYPSVSDTIADLDKETNGLEEDDTADKNLRYVGASPKNYITFNDETWRIIGIFNVFNVETNTTEKLVKIVRNDSLGDYSWDSSDSSKNNGYGINEWSQADLMNELNTDYINPNPTSETTEWFNGRNNAKNGSYNYSNNMKSTSMDKIAKVRWNLGGYSTSQVTALNMYNAERGTLHISNPSDETTRTNTWDGKIALIYPSDYGYASTDTTCRGDLMSSDSNYKGYCKNENWLFNGAYQWTLSPSSGNASNVFYVDSDGYVGSGSAINAIGVRPALFLKSDVVVTSGTGDEKDPYKISSRASFANDAWETIANNVKSEKSYLYNIGDEKEVEIGGTNYTVRVANNTTPSDCNKDDFSQTACGFVVEFVDIVENRKMNSTDTNVGGWPATAMRTYLNDEFYNSLPEDLRNVIADTKVISGHGKSDTSNFPSTDKIYLLSGHEIYEDASPTTSSLSARDTAYNNTRQLDYYKNKGVTTRSYLETRKKPLGSSSYDWWWLRAANSSSDDNFLSVGSDGDWNIINASDSSGVSPAFRIG